MDVLNSVLDNVSSLWVFGYGSILWKTGFHYERKKIGYIKGYARRFWQGSTSHRGTPQNPGRVATLIPTNRPIKSEEGIYDDQDGSVWGAAYELVGRDMIVEALDHLGVRECLLGGYISVMTPFYERPSSSSDDPSPHISVLMFTATEANELFLGPADSLESLASQIISCRGPCGHNIQYVLRLSNYMREHVPEERDPHLFGLVAAIEAGCRARGLDVEELIAAAHSHPPRASQVCARCNALCSEYAFCKGCRADAIKDALTCGPDARSLTHPQPPPTPTQSPTAECELPPPKKSPIATRRNRTSSHRDITENRRTEITVASQ